VTLMLPRPDTITPEQWKIVDEFHATYYNRATSWLGYPIIKNPMDLLIYQQLIVATQPQTIIECGTGGGGSALFFASVLALMGQGGQVVTIDTNGDLEKFYAWAFPDTPRTCFPAQRPASDNLLYLTANTIAPSTVRKVKALCEGRVMVVLDSTHTMEHVLDECELYGPLVTPGCYLVVEDINIAGHPVFPEWPDGGPYEACERFLAAHPEFTWEPSLVGYYLFSYNAYLQRRRAEDTH
jgi:cephalosporin hydroxylase